MSGSGSAPALGDVVTRLPVGELTWDDLVVEPEVRDGLLALGDAVLSGGLVVVVAGPGGVGKTFATRVWAESLRLDMWRVDCALLLERHGDRVATRGLDEALAFGRRPLGIILLDRPGELVRRERDALLGRLGERRAPTVLELDADVPPEVEGLPLIRIGRPGPALRRRQWERLVRRASPLSSPDYDALAALELTGAQIDAAVRKVVLEGGDERLATEALVAAASPSELESE